MLNDCVLALVSCVLALESCVLALESCVLALRMQLSTFTHPQVLYIPSSIQEKKL
jgi:hypothetical protein